MRKELNLALLKKRRDEIEKEELTAVRGGLPRCYMCSDGCNEFYNYEKAKNEIYQQGAPQIPCTCDWNIFSIFGLLL